MGGQVLRKEGFLGFRGLIRFPLRLKQLAVIKPEKRRPLLTTFANGCHSSAGAAGDLKPSDKNALTKIHNYLKSNVGPL